MAKSHQQLYNILSACAGNWRNCVYISADSSDYLLSTDRDGRPIVMPVEQFRQLSGENVDPAECCEQLSAEGFKTLYAQYLLWHMPSAEEDPLGYLGCTVPKQK
ncbi:MAG: hypothetical protein K2M42_09925 [Oscillospiraceae bacterium]|nr:hypothetical protein [Oscillospiraceae bacterium]